ncbi:peptidase S8 and S53 subtilisin kexin sedolisin [Pontibacter diazotrophicus]|uniref:Peptidase S8 and S53 subtilisin kexin sedolisin n=2 Tax=Pontibacter diazotrophicus TaxID=1400979 RepID=A0A3D8LIU0_9BACT|nr:peptidase S8 and S53 subtilisin kexin sedolisin [Pontibacter diazotrophicus]
MLTNLTKKITYPVLAAALAFGCTPDQEQITPTTTMNAEATSALLDGSENSSVRFKSNDYIIISSSSSLPADLEGQIKSLNGKITGQMKKVGIATVSSTDADFAEKARKIKGVSSVIRDVEIQWYNPESFKTAEVDATNINPASTGDSNPFFAFQWGATAIQAPAAWNTGARGKGVKVAVLDSGFHLDHPDLKDNIIYSKSFVPGETVRPVGTGFSHGTHVAGTIAAADNNLGVIGIAPEASLILLKVLGDSGSGSFGWMMEGIMHAVEQEADVINMSLGAYLPRNGKYLDENGNVINDTKATQELLVAITRVTNYATQQGVTIISSAGNSAIDGNSDKSGISIPAGMPNVISISSTAPSGWAANLLGADLDGVASYTNYGTPDVTFAAPGGDSRYPGNENGVIAGLVRPVWVFDMILSTGTATSYNWVAGTSMASPHAAGVAALIIGQNGGKMHPKQVEAAMRASADDLGKTGRDPYYGYGRVNAFKAVTATIQ